MTTCFGAFPVMMKPPIPASSPRSTRIRLERLTVCEAGVGVGVGVGVGPSSSTMFTVVVAWLPTRALPVGVSVTVNSSVLSGALSLMIGMVIVAVEERAGKVTSPDCAW
jgi:hypothetical protein